MILLFSLLGLCLNAYAKDYHTLGGKLIGHEHDGYLIDYRGRMIGYITDEGQYLDSKARPKGYVDEDRILDVNGGQPLDFEDE